MNNNKKWYIIDWKSGIKRVIDLFKLYPIVEQSDKDLFLLFGYKNLSPGDKETYYLIKELAILNEKKYKRYQCQVSLGYLADVLDTTVECQSRRVKKLKSAYLLKIIPSKADTNTYIPLIKAYPDSTLVSTIIKLIRRKKLYAMMSIYEQEKGIIQHPASLESIKYLVKKVPAFTRYLSKELKSKIQPSL